MAVSGMMRVRCVALVAVMAGVLAASLAAQEGGPATPDSVDLLEVAKAAQDRFERQRTTFFPVDLAGRSSHRCDEYVGRFCLWYPDGEWYPTPEDPAVDELRAELVDTFDSIAKVLPDEPWLLGQRVWYRGQRGRWDDALDVARTCGVEDRWLCSALEGLALHELGEFESAEVAFDRALGEMDAERAELWRIPRRLVPPSIRRTLDEAASSSADSLTAVLGRLWTLADPLYLIEGNDRLTEHYARWIGATLHEEMRNPHRMRWGRDSEELAVRHGWAVGWERRPLRDFSSLDDIIGHEHPEARKYVPESRAVLEPTLVTADEMVPDFDEPRSFYTPEYAPVFLPMHGQLAVFPRPGETAIVATFALPEDTTKHADHEHEKMWLEPGDQAGMLDRVGLYAVSLADGEVSGLSAIGRTDGGLMLTVPPDDYILSAEVWSPSKRRAGRQRAGAPRREAPEDVATLSDIVLTRHLETPPASLRSAVPDLLPAAIVAPGEAFGIAWEVAGLGFQAEALYFDVSVAPADRNALRRLGDFLRITARPRPLELSWEEPGPDAPETLFRHLNLDLPDLDPGTYEITLTLGTASRSETSTRLRFVVVDGGS